MKRPLCCICAAFVAAVFLYNKFNSVQDMIYDNSRVIYDGSRITVSGEIYQKEYKDDVLILYLRHIKKQDLPECAVCYINTDANGKTTEPKLGSVVTVEGVVSCFDEVRNPGGFDALMYYKILGVDFRLHKAQILHSGGRYSMYNEALYRIRCYFEVVFDKALAEKDAAVMKAVLLGRKSELDEQSRQLYQSSGIAHIFAISGLHISILGMGLYKLLKKSGLPLHICAVISIFLMISYGNMTGMSSSAYRAVFMFGMKLLSDILKRTYDMMTALALAAVLLLAEQPLYLYHSGFLLSFGAILGISCFGSVLKPAESLGIFIVHFPIMLCTYYEFPIYSFFLNIVIIPAMTIVMAAGLLCLGLGSLPFIVSIKIAEFVGVLCHILLLLLEQLCSLSLKLPFSNWIVGRPENWRIYIYAGVMMFLYIMHQCAVYMSKKKACQKRGVKIGLPLNIRLITVLAAVVLLSDSSIDGMSMTFLDVGQGDCIWIESSKGEHFLIDGGSTSENKVGQYTIAPYLKYMGVSKLDAVFLTHLDSDHISGILELMDSGSGTGNGLKIGRICISDAVIEDEAYQKLAALCQAEMIPLYRLKTGDKIKAAGLCFEVLHPQKGYAAASRNAYSLAMKLDFTDPKGHKVTALLTGDVESDGETQIIQELGSGQEFEGIDIYKAAHHGSRYSNSQELLTAIKPVISVISCGENNSYGHPHNETIEKLKSVNSDILITKDTGAIMIKIKGGRYSVTPYRMGD